MYIKLGNTKINYRTAAVDKYMILAEVVNSSMSYETPVVISNVSELNALFSKDFDDYIYLKRILESYRNVALYLFKPFSSIKSKAFIEDEGYIDYSSYEILEPYTIFTPTDEYITYFEEWKETPNMSISVFRNGDNYSEGICYKRLVGENWEEVINPDVVFKGEAVAEDKLDQFKTIKTSNNICIKLGEKVWVYSGVFGFVLESDLPQNMARIDDSVSLDNRSTLFIPEGDLIDYIHPEYLNKKGLGTFSYPDVPTISLENINPEEIRTGRKTLALRLSKVSENMSEGSLAFLDTNTKNCFYIFNADHPSITAGTTTLYQITSSTSTTALDEIKTKIDTSSYPGEKLTTFWDGEDLIICGKEFIDLGYNTFDNIKIEPDYEISQAILYKSLPNLNGVGFWSKTIGGTSEFDEAGIIKIQVDEIEDNQYSITISRYDYSETFQGSFIPEPGTERLDYLINKSSKLVHIKLLGSVESIKTGTFYMSRGKYTKQYSNRDWMNALKTMFDVDNERTKVDFLLIPNIQDYVAGLSIDSSHYSEYETILNYAKEGNFQALIQNRDSKYKYVEVNDVLDLADNFANDTIYHISNNTDNYFSAGEIKEINQTDKLLYNRDTAQMDENIRTVIFSEDCPPNCYIQIDEFSQNITGSDWATYFPDGFSLKFKNKSAHYQKIMAPKRTAGLVGDSLVQDFLLSPNESIVIQIEHKTVGVFKWNKIDYDYNSGYYLSNEDKELKEITDQKTIGEAIYGGDYIYNYNDDENRLIYFFRSIYTATYRVEYPGYCIFLDGILTGNYSGDVSSILYNPPVNNPYQLEPIESVLEKFRSNFLVFNGQKYYYKKYFEGNNKQSSIFLRFIIGKITREILKKKNLLIGEKILGKMRQLITDTLFEVENSFSLVKSIKILNFSPDTKNNTLNIELSTSTNSMLVDKDVILNITLNINK